MKPDISLYAILDPTRVKNRPLESMAQEAAKGGATILQYRDKDASTRTFIERAEKVKRTLSPFALPFIINDRVDIALAVAADGVHLGQSDMDPKQARALLGSDKIIGQTIKTPDDVKAAPIDVLDYVCIGGVFDTLSKENADSIGVEGFARLAQNMRARNADLPIGAIAGIDYDRLPSLFEAGADGVAIISAIFMSERVEAETKRLKARIKELTS